MIFSKIFFKIEDFEIGVPLIWLKNVVRLNCFTENIAKFGRTALGLKKCSSLAQHFPPNLLISGNQDTEIYYFFHVWQEGFPFQILRLVRSIHYCSVICLAPWQELLVNERAGGEDCAYEWFNSLLERFKTKDSPIFLTTG